MAASVHPREALAYRGERPFPIIPGCEHIAGSEKLIRRSFELQAELGPVFDVTCDCEDGARPGSETSHAEMVVRLLDSAENRQRMAGARVHDATHPHWRRDVEILVSGAGHLLAYLTLPKVTSCAQAAEMIVHVQQVAAHHGVRREIPIHVLVETHGALREAREIAALPWMQTLDFGLMDFVSAHHGAIPAAAMRSPGQFEHALLARAKTEIAAAALSCGIVPSHNISLDLRNAYATFQDARRARNEFGFLRMWSIHPAQILPIVDAMKPDFSEVQEAAAILAAAQDAGWGPVRHRGEMHDMGTYRYYWDMLRKARATGVTVPPEAMKRFF
ncbi:MAG: CoA ester lyase [Burkholderiales bacterium]|nr:CoA ester lyase [Burkholderiales bacterium]